MVSFKPKDPQFKSRVEASFNQQQVMKTLGVKIVNLQPGEIELMMPYAAAYTQHHGFIHAGIGQVRELLDIFGWALSFDGCASRPTEASYSSSTSFLTAAICRRS